MPRLQVLISGAGITGPVVAHFLKELADAEVTIVERAPSLRATGQNIDLRGNGWHVVKKMGLEGVVRSNSTGEKGMRFVDEKSQVWGEFPVDGTKGFTSEIEVMRGDLAKLLYESTKDKVKYVFGTSIESIRQEGDGVHVDFSSEDMPSRSYDIVIGADGWSSNTRKLAFGADSADAVKSLGQHMAYFSIPREASDSDWALWYNAPKGRMYMVRPDAQHDTTRVVMAVTRPGRETDAELEKVLRLSRDDQMKILRQRFFDAGWETQRFLEGMNSSDDFYYQKVVQVKLSTWSSGRVVLVGDAAYCPSPISGMGTTLGICGAYILAGEIAAAHRSGARDFTPAFQKYEDNMRPLVNKGQSLPPGIPALANPQTAWGIKVMNTIIYAITRLGLLNLFSIDGPAATEFTLPEYS